MEINDYPNKKDKDLWDSEGMYNTDKFEGDIANDVGIIDLANIILAKCIHSFIIY